MLSISSAVGYIEEPFSLRHRRGILDVNFPFWFPYVCSENETPFIEPVRDMLAFRYGLGAEMKTLRSPKDAARLIRDRSRFGRHRRRGARPLIKDPVAVFSAEWLAERFSSCVVVTIRHPAGFVSSIMRLGWSHPFDHFLRQPLLLRDLLGPFEDQIRAFASRERPLLDQAILLWNLIHHAIREYRARHPDWLFVRHEDMATAPIEGFRGLYRELGLPFNETVRASIAGHSSRREDDDRINPFDVRRDSRATVSVWRARLTEEEVEHVRSGVEPIAHDFYSDAELEGSPAP